jgi:hypothetical protein
MSAYNGMSKRIKNALKTVLTGITYDTGSSSEAAFVSVKGSTKGEFDGYPAVRVLPGDVTTDKASVAENDRGVAFIVRVHLLMENKPESEEDTYDWMYDLTDLILDTLDIGDYTGVLNSVDNTLDTLMLNATRGDWMVAETNAAAVLLCDVNLNVRYSKRLA